jgi:hypothetical protein
MEVRLSNEGSILKLKCRYLPFLETYQAAAN